MRIYLLAILLFVATFSFGQLPVFEDDSCVYTIPVVVHIMNPVKGSQLVSPMQVQYAIDYLNLVFAGKYPGMKPHTADGAAGDVGIRFQLAKQDENGKPTNGIDIVYVNEKMPSIKTQYAENGVTYQMAGKGCKENTLKGLARWERTRYLNIWVVNKIDGNEDAGGMLVKSSDYWGFSLDGVLGNKRTMAAGTIPELFNPDPSSQFYIGKDGLLILAFLLKDGFNERKSDLVHEIGHYLNLYHVFSGDETFDKDGKVIKRVYTCPDSDIAKGDKVGDTDPVTEFLYSPNVEPKDRYGEENPCTGKPYKINTEHNFMSYNPNKYQSLFTNDQKTRMRNCLNDSNLRKELVCTFKETGDNNSEENNLKRFGNNVVSRVGKKLVLKLKSGKKTVVLTDNGTDDRDDGVNYHFIGYSDDLNCFIVENIGYESSSYSFYNRKNGAETIAPSIDFKILPSQKKVIFYNEEGDENGNAFSYTEDGLNSLL